MEEEAKTNKNEETATKDGNQLKTEEDAKVVVEKGAHFEEN